ncbi:MAG: hypothetical protein KAR56_02640 [Thermoplasmata archaeon]|nr:hypothetical protein [Thermoplasmata archaeon]
MERVDNLTCEGCLHLQIKKLTSMESKHCSYCLRSNGETRAWHPESRDLLMYIMDCYINPGKPFMPTISRLPGEDPIKRMPPKKEKASDV